MTDNGPILVTGAARSTRGGGANVAMGELHRAGRYDRLAEGVERVTGRPAISVREFVSLHADEFGGRRASVLKPQRFQCHHATIPVRAYT